MRFASKAEADEALARMNNTEFAGSLPNVPAILMDGLGSMEG